MNLIPVSNPNRISLANELQRASLGVVETTLPRKRSAQGRCRHPGPGPRLAVHPPRQSPRFAPDGLRNTDILNQMWVAVFAFRPDTSTWPLPRQ